jgi:hypothetical protein
MTPISCYDPNRFDRELPANVRGGLQRAKQVARDSLGRFQPKNYHLLYDIHHGVDGGKKRAATAKRDEHGRFTS